MLVIINDGDDSPGQDLFAIRFLELCKRGIGDGALAEDCRFPRKLGIGQLFLRGGQSGPPGGDFCGCVRTKFHGRL